MLLEASLVEIVLVDYNNLVSMLVRSRRRNLHHMIGLVMVVVAVAQELQVEQMEDSWHNMLVYSLVHNFANKVMDSLVLVVVEQSGQLERQCSNSVYMLEHRKVSTKIRMDWLKVPLA